MSRARAEQTSTGNALLVVVGLGMLFLLFTAFLGVMKAHAGPIYGESNMLYAALIFYGGASALYMGFGVTGIERYVKFASLSTALGFAANTAAGAHRWYLAGHPPFSTLYEMLLSFVWTVALLTLIAERRYQVKIIGSVTMPLAVVSVILMQLLPSEVRPLVPALQSTWLHVHVSLAMLAYAACAVSFALAMMFLIQDGMKTETFQVLTAAGMVAVYAGMMLRFRSGGLAVVGWDPVQNSEIFVSRGVRLFVTIPDLGWLCALVLLSTIVPVLLYVFARMKQDDSFFDHANKAMFVSILLQAVVLVAFMLRVQNGSYASAGRRRLFPDGAGGESVPALRHARRHLRRLALPSAVWRREGLQQMLPPAGNLDQITYKTICVAFPLLTLMIAVGAYWANQTWGSYWSWDPKETWAAITWLVYAGYLHMRVTRGWKGRRAAYFAILGFAVVIFTFFGVTYLLPGLHAYA